VDLTGWVGVGLGGNCDCRCGILYAAMLGGGVGGFVGLVSLIFLLILLLILYILRNFLTSNQI